jgi:hypothetical protein
MAVVSSGYGTGCEEHKKNHGVLSVKTTNPSKVLRNSINNNYDRWSSGQTPAPWISTSSPRFVDFMQQRWAPIGAENDPKNLNQNWAPNVRMFLKQILDKQQYQKARDLNLVMNQGGSQWI